MATGSSSSFGFGLALVALALAEPASAHIELLEPAPRYTGTENKSCPCGAGLSNRVCDVARDGADPARSDNVTSFEVGSTITIRFSEYVGHSGRFRVAFDPDGADVADFNANILLDVPDPANVTSNAADGLWEFEVTLPDTPCETCTLQLIQAMHGDTENPVTDPSGLSSYYTCADIVLVAQGSAPTSGSTGSSVSQGGATSSAISATGMGATSSGETSSSGVAGGTDEDSGCACKLGSSTIWSARGLAAPFLLLSLFGARRTRMGTRRRAN